MCTVHGQTLEEAVGEFWESIYLPNCRCTSQPFLFQPSHNSVWYYLSSKFCLILFTLKFKICLVLFIFIIGAAPPILSCFNLVIILSGIIYLQEFVCYYSTSKFCLVLSIFKILSGIIHLKSFVWYYLFS